MKRIRCSFALALLLVFVQQGAVLHFGSAAPAP